MLITLILYGSEHIGQWVKISVTINGSVGYKCICGFGDMLIGSEIPQIGMGPNLHLVESGVSETEMTPRPFLRELGRTPSERCGLLPIGRAARISLDIRALGIFRVVKTTTLISVKLLIHSNLQVTLQLRGRLPFVSMLICSWDFLGQKYGTAKNASIRNRGDAYF